MTRSAFMLALSTASLIAGCAPMANRDGAAPATATATAAPTAKAMLMAADGSARGSATLTEASDGLHVLVRATGLTPGIHAVHVHMTGACTAPDFTSAGGHWNPAGKQHGRDNPAGMHMGDMPNITVAADGTGEMEYAIAGGTIASGATPLLDTDGAAVVIHAAPDDYHTDPTGNAGGRIACGVINPS